MRFEYFINKDERGEFYADVRNPDGKTVLDVREDVFEDGWMKHKGDLLGLREYLIHLEIMAINDSLVWG